MPGVPRCPMNVVPCSSCGCPMVWVTNRVPHPKTKKRARVPLDARGPYFRIVAAGEAEPVDPAPVVDGALAPDCLGPVLISHFATCPQAAGHSKTKTQVVVGAAQAITDLVQHRDAGTRDAFRTRVAALIAVAKPDTVQAAVDECVQVIAGSGYALHLWFVDGAGDQCRAKLVDVQRAGDAACLHADGRALNAIRDVRHQFEKANCDSAAAQGKYDRGAP